MDALEYCFWKINSQEGVRGSVDFCLSKISSDNQTNKNNVPLLLFYWLVCFLCWKCKGIEVALHWELISCVTLALCWSNFVLLFCFFLSVLLMLQPSQSLACRYFSLIYFLYVLLLIYSQVFFMVSKFCDSLMKFSFAHLCPNNLPSG